MKKISVIVPVYNAEKWLKETLDSLIKQTYANVEIVCVDDGSHDNSCEIIKGYQYKNENIKLIQQENAGVCAARNAGMDAASGEYIAFVDADDVVESIMYEKMINKLEQEEADIVFCEFVRFWPDGHKQYTVEESFAKLAENPQDIKYFIYSTDSHVEGEILYTKDIHGSVCRSVFKTKLIKENNIRFHTNLRFAEDQIFILEYLQVCKKCSYLSNPFVWYRGWTKKNGYHRFYENHMNLACYQEQIILKNDFYSTKEKKQMLGYVKCTAYFMILNDEFVFNPEAVENIKKYNKNPKFRDLFTVYSFIQKYKVKPEAKRIVLLILIKLRRWNVIKKLYPAKRY